MKALHKNIVREIQRTKSRFFSILAIMAISTGFFSGIKSASPSLIETGRSYFEDNNLMDIRLISTVGFDDDDIDAIYEHESTVAVMPSYQADLTATVGGVDSVIRVHALPEVTDTNPALINTPYLVSGRMPESDDECVVDSYNFSSSGYGVGDTITFNETTDGQKATDTIKHLSYKVVGTVMTPLYITYQRGNTNIGSGALDYYIMILPEAFVTERYTCVYVQTNATDGGISDVSQTYKDIISDQAEEYEALSEERIDIFNKTTYADARKKLDDAKKEYTEQKADAEKQLADGEKKLRDGEREADEKLLEGKQKLLDGEKELEEGKKQYEEGQQAYLDGLEEAKTKLADAQKQYDDGKAQYDKAQLEYDVAISEGESKLAAAKSEFDTQYSLFYGTTKPQAETKLTLLKTAIDLCRKTIDEINESIEKLEHPQLPETVQEGIDFITDNSETAANIQSNNRERLDELKEKLTEYTKKLDEYEKQYNDGTAQLEEGEKQLNDAKAKLEEAQSEFDTQKAENALKLGEAKITLDNAKSQLDDGKFQYETGMITGMLQLEGAAAKLTEGEKELEKGRRELEEQSEKAMQELKSAREELAAGKAEMKTKLADAEKQLDDAEDSLEAIKDAKWYVYTREDNPGYSGLVEDGDRVDSVAKVFPVFFMLVALLVCLTTMTRMVEERRTEIGTLKALGYSDLSIAAKYFVYSSSASLIGSLAGAAAGVTTLPYIIVSTYEIMYILPPTHLSIDWSSIIFSTLLGIVCTCAVSMFTCLGELRIRPAALMRPKAPKPGKRILLEYIKPLWSLFNFTSKVTARNIFRYKARFLMTVIGVAGCTALMVGGMGLRDSIGVVADRQFGELSLYDVYFVLSDQGTAEENEYLMSQFHRDKRFDTSLLVYQHRSEAYFGKNHYHNDMNVCVPENLDDFKNMFVLRTRQEKTPISLTDDGVVITERLSEILEAEIGDEISFKIGEDYYSAKLTAICENYAGNTVYLTPALYERLTGEETEYNVVMTKLTEAAADSGHDVSADWMAKDEILTAALLQDQVDKINSSLESLNIIVLVLVLCSGLLAVVVLYNLTNINISERVREIATIKVLGFYDLETANYIYRENTILTLAGAAAGLPLGTVFSVFITSAIQMDMVMYPMNIEPLSYIAGFMLTVFFSLMVNLVMYKKMKQISMVESLKSIE